MISQRCNCWKRRAKSLDAILMLHQLRQGIKGNKQEVVDILYLFVLQGVNKFLPFLVIPYLMVKLGATGYGYIGFSLSVIQYLALIIDFEALSHCRRRQARAHAHLLGRILGQDNAFGGLTVITFYSDCICPHL